MQIPDNYRRAIMGFSARIRDPQQTQPEGLDTARVAVYSELFFNNLNQFLSSGFPVFKSLMTEQWWLQEVRGFLLHHRCRSPLFCEIGREYLDYVASDTRPKTPQDPPFMQELLHYEWVELALDIAPCAVPLEDLGADVISGCPMPSPLAWLLEYRYPVHRICKDFQPTHPGDSPSWLLVYRNREQRVGFMALNAFSARLLALLEQTPDTSGEQILLALAEESTGIDSRAIVSGGTQLLQQWYELGVILGARTPSEQASFTRI